MDQAENFVRELLAALEKLATDLATSIDIKDVRPEYRKVYAGSHVIFFKVLSDGIDVVRILHQKMDFNRHLS